MATELENILVEMTKLIGENRDMIRELRKKEPNNDVKESKFQQRLKEEMKKLKD